MPLVLDKITEFNKVPARKFNQELNKWAISKSKIPTTKEIEDNEIFSINLDRFYDKFPKVKIFLDKYKIPVLNDHKKLEETGGRGLITHENKIYVYSDFQDYILFHESVHAYFRFNRMMSSSSCKILGDIMPCDFDDIDDIMISLFEEEIINDYITIRIFGDIDNNKERMLQYMNRILNINNDDKVKLFKTIPNMANSSYMIPEIVCKVMNMKIIFGEIKKIIAKRKVEIQSVFDNLL